MRAGIFAGSFDPIHQGHVDFALSAIRRAKLDKVYFLPEAKPRTKPTASHLAHRLAMLKLAILPHSSLDVLELPDRQFTVGKSLPRLNQKFHDDELFLMIGSDLLEHLGDWPLADRLLTRMGLIIGLRHGFRAEKAKTLIRQLPIKTGEVFILSSPGAKVSSAAIRQAVRSGQKPENLDSKVYEYIKSSWLYVAVSD